MTVIWYYQYYVRLSFYSTDVYFRFYHVCLRNRLFILRIKAQLYESIFQAIQLEAVLFISVCKAYRDVHNVDIVYFYIVISEWRIDLRQVSGTSCKYHKMRSVGDAFDKSTQRVVWMAYDTSAEYVRSKRKTMKKDLQCSREGLTKCQQTFASS